MFNSYKEALAAVGGLSEPSKMPCYGWSVSARRCGVGSKLAEVKNSVCSGCYALRGNYNFPAVQNCLERRWDALHKDTFVPAMVYLMKALTPSFFRWYDSGDLDSAETLQKIVDIANQTPEVKYWLPTKEYKLIQDFVSAGGVIPSNVCVRLSSYMIDEDGPVSLAQRLGVTTSEVRRESYTCPSSAQGNKCLACRLCWNRETFNVTYKKH